MWGREGVGEWGAPTSQPGEALCWPAHPGVWLVCSGLWAVWPQPWPPCSCFQASAAPGAQTPRAIRAPELLIFLKRLAALTAMKFFCGMMESDPSASGQGRSYGPAECLFKSPLLQEGQMPGKVQCSKRPQEAP